MGTIIFDKVDNFQSFRETEGFYIPQNTPTTKLSGNRKYSQTARWIIVGVRM